ncbi:PREDICTED: uncharacterized protein LOC109126510 [Camelina sativa]|uniref:Uncharacterized protein LOC109126510 n=1 Tax=Camelina sativa TaxID=90675 RepID=A0ABM1QFZ1_CAMSA|nr:PREDICTED: uncharacterized protein LOC109126510 [Camelina sativa]
MDRFQLQFYNVVAGWVKLLEPAYLLWKPTDSDYERPPYMTRTEKDKLELTPDQELALITKEVNDSDGFDIDFRPFSCVFNYHPAILHSCEFSDDETETCEDLLKRLAQGSLNDHNGKCGTNFEFVKIVKATYHFAAAIMYLITFQVKDPYDDKIKLFQTRVLHADNIRTEYVFCRPQPNQGVECIGIIKDVYYKDVKKQRLE